MSQGIVLELTEEFPRQALHEQIARCSDPAQRAELTAQLLGCQCRHLHVEGAVHCTKGQNISVGTALYLSAGCEIQDLGTIQIGDCVVIGPAVKIHAEPTHPVRIGHRVWIGANVQIAPGSTIGDDAVVCAETRVTGNVPANAIVTGDPARLVRSIV